MRHAGFGSVVLVASWFAADAAFGQTATSPNAGPLFPPANTAASSDISARPDADRYYWHNGRWWYLTQQNAWLRWDGSTWVRNPAGVTRALRPVQVQPAANIDPADTGVIIPTGTSYPYGRSLDGL